MVLRKYARGYLKDMRVARPATAFEASPLRVLGFQAQLFAISSISARSFRFVFHACENTAPGAF
jgi:hypothetical protein